MHKARHTAGQRVLDHTRGNLKATQKLLGHSSISTTADIYVDWDIDKLAETLKSMLEDDAVYAPGRNRTCDLALRRRTLYPLSYRREGVSLAADPLVPGGAFIDRSTCRRRPGSRRRGSAALRLTLVNWS